MRSSGKPRPTSRSLAASANGDEPHTNAVASGSDRGREVVARQPPGRSRPAGRRVPRVDDGGLGAGQLVGVVEVRRACRTETTRCTRSLRPRFRASRSIAISGTTPEPPPTSSAGVVAVPDEPSADRSADLELVTDDHLVVEERRDLAVLEALDGQLDLVRVVGRRRHRVRAGRGVAVGRGEPDDVVLARAVARRFREREPEGLRRRRLVADRDDRGRLPRARRCESAWARCQSPWYRCSSHGSPRSW